MNDAIHETAIVEPDVLIGGGTKIWHHAHIRAGSEIGENCTIGKNVFVDAGVTIGDRVKIQNNVSVYSGVFLEDDVFVGPSAVFTNDRLPRASSQDWKVVETRVRRGASIGANATLVAPVEIGAWSMVAAGAVVTRSVEPYELVAGNPARRIGWICRCGQVLARGSDPLVPTTCGHCGTRIPGEPD